MNKKLGIAFVASIMSLSAMAASFGGKDLTREQHEAMILAMYFSTTPKVTSPTVAESFKKAGVGKKNTFVQVVGDSVNGFKPVKFPKANKSKVGVGNAGKGKLPKNKSYGKGKAIAKKHPVAPAPIAQVVPVAQVQAGPAQAGPAVPVVQQPVAPFFKHDIVAASLLDCALDVNGDPYVFAPGEKAQIQNDFDTGKVCVKKYNSWIGKSKVKQYHRCGYPECEYVLANKTIARGHYLSDHYGMRWTHRKKGTLTKDATIV